MRKHEEIAGAFSETSSLDDHDGFFLVGIGGAGMSALARLLNRRGYDVTGTDGQHSAEIERLREEGIDCTVGHTGDRLTKEQALVVSDAIDLCASPEIARALELQIPIVRRSQALGWILNPYKVIAVAGTHGKTTTTAMLGCGLIEAGFDPLVVVGASVPDWGGPIREGNGTYAVVEACEAYDSFHDLEPYIVLLTNLELDHIDFHGSYANLRDSVVRFVDKLPQDGWLVYCSEDRGACEVAELSSARAVPYGASVEWQRQIANMLGLKSGLPPLPSEKGLALPGRHNLLNAAGALTAAALVRANLERVEQALRRFQGAERRLQALREGDITVVDDYAHHPSEIAASISALREKYFGKGKPGRRLIAVFQPHLYSRTANLIAEFAAALSRAEEVILTDVYPARETPMPGVGSARIAELLTVPVSYVPNRRLLPRYVAERARPGDVIVGMGAGNISEFGPDLVNELDRVDLLSKGERPLSVAILYGGDSAEREVSIHSGRSVQAALENLGYASTLIDASDMLLSGEGLSSLTGEDRPDVVFLAVHGTHAEDGAVQGLLELLHLPYTGSGVQASAVCMDKQLTKQILNAHGIRTPKGQLLTSPDDAITQSVPLIVKPNEQGSTVGLSFVETAEQLCPALRRAFSYGDQVLVEEWIQGTEISTPVLNGEALAPVEIQPVEGRYDYANKYVPGATEELIPARIGEEGIKRAKEIALEAHRVLNCEGASRTDAIVKDGEVYVLEVNSIPGLTPTSLLPNSAHACGISFEELCRRLIEDALQRHAAKVH